MLGAVMQEIHPSPPRRRANPKPTSTAPTQTKVIFVPEETNVPPTVICDLAEADAFVETYRKPHVPVMSAFGAAQLHVCRMNGAWDLNQMMADHANVLFRSIRKVPSESDKETTKEWDDLTFRFGPRSFLYADATRIVSFATTPEKAEQGAARFAQKYRKPKSPVSNGGIFLLIQREGDNFKTKDVALLADTILSSETLRLHYGNDIEVWQQQFLHKLCIRRHGLTIFEGKPGTGKTCYLRHLMGELKATHRFYFLPAATLSVLSKPEFVGFWTEQRWHHPEKKFVVIMEDSDEALLTRGADNREQVSALLNLTDGMLGDFLQLQIICTINCSATDIDPALLRPGRLLCHRIFGKLEYSQAVRLAESLGRKLPEVGEYSLAEVFAERNIHPINRPRVGFAA